MALKNISWVFQIWGKRGLFEFYWTFVDWETVLELQLEYLGGQRKGSNKFDYSLWLLGVKEKEKINSTTLCGFKNVTSLYNFWWKRGLFWIFIGIFKKLNFFLESQGAYLGWSKKRKKSIWPLLMALNKCFLSFYIFQ